MLPRRTLSTRIRGALTPHDARRVSLLQGEGGMDGELKGVALWMAGFVGMAIMLLIAAGIWVRLVPLAPPAPAPPAIDETGTPEHQRHELA
jgi:hypothetical protein